MNKFNPNHPTGQSHHSAKLDNRKVRAIRALHKLNFSPTEISRLFTVSRSSVQKVLARQTWTHVR